MLDEDATAASAGGCLKKTFKPSKLERIPGSIDGGSRELPSAAAADDDQSVPNVHAVAPPAFDRRSLDLGKLRPSAEGPDGAEVDQQLSPTRPPLSSDNDDAVVPSS